MGESIEYPVPSYARPEVREYFRSMNTVRSEGYVLADLPSGRIFGAGAVLSSDGTLLARDVSGDHGNPAEYHWLLGFKRLRLPQAVNGSTAVVAVNLGDGYAHWLLEEFPRLLSVPAGCVENLLLHVDSGLAREALRLRGGAEQVIAVRREQHLACAPLLVPGLVATAATPVPRTLRLIDEFTESLGRVASGCGERVYFSREKAGRRRVANEAALWGMLEANGFKKVCLEELTWDQQIGVCRRARVVVAPHGAGLANIVFCSPGTRVVELLSRRYCNPGYWRLAVLRGLDYRPVVAAGVEPLGEDRRANRDDILANLEQVRSAIS
ncbi:hypothetical protein IMCC26134_07620 [Verrucomicrobia bacterium IMCC26134]|nr:hypothetical protein IMCC26134_07620 [Verrucomicrobia bacterium IMCC26134]